MNDTITPDAISQGLPYYEVWSYENANISERGNSRTIGRFTDADHAIAVAKRVVDTCLDEGSKLDAKAAKAAKDAFLAWGDVSCITACNGAKPVKWDAYGYLEQRLEQRVIATPAV